MARDNIAPNLTAPLEKPTINSRLSQLGPGERFATAFFFFLFFFLCSFFSFPFFFISEILSSSKSVGYVTYLVTPKDTLGTIAMAHNMSLMKLR
jgi:hypothetical protein